LPGITLQQAGTFQVAANAVGDRMRQLRELIPGGCLDPTKAYLLAVPGINVDTIQKQHVEMGVEIQRTTEALDQRHCTGLCRSWSKACFVGEVRSDSAVGNAQCLAHDSRLTGKQKA